MNNTLNKFTVNTKQLEHTHTFQAFMKHLQKLTCSSSENKFQHIIVSHKPHSFDHIQLTQKSVRTEF